MRKTTPPSPANLAKMRLIMLEMGLSDKTIDALIADHSDLQSLSDSALSAFVANSQKIAGSKL